MKFLEILFCCWCYKKRYLSFKQIKASELDGACLNKNTQHNLSRKTVHQQFTTFFLLSFHNHQHSRRKCCFNSYSSMLEQAYFFWDAMLLNWKRIDCKKNSLFDLSAENPLIFFLTWFRVLRRGKRLIGKEKERERERKR